MEAKHKREAQRRQHSMPAEQFPGATARFRREFVENPFGVTCAVCDRLWFAGDLSTIGGVSDEKKRESGACALRQCIEYSSAGSLLKCGSCFQLVGEGTPALSTYLSYLDFEEAQGDPTRVQSLYERAISDHCLVPELWERYMAYLDTKLKVDAVSLPCHERSVRNCPWSSSLWVSHLKALERSRSPHQKLTEAMEQALGAGFGQGQDYQKLWLTFLDYLRRRVDWSQGDSSEALRDLRRAFEKAVEHLVQYQEETDLCSPILKYWAKVEAKFCDNLPKARELWNEVTHQGRATDALTWLDFANFER
ncbi:squamous cell carcinoma antigen recognized by T-cells 3 [Ixodes scapularis]